MKILHIIIGIWYGSSAVYFFITGRGLPAFLIAFALITLIFVIEIKRRMVKRYENPTIRDV